MRRFFVPDKEKCVAFLRAQKNVLPQNRTKGEARLRFCGSRAPKGGEAHTILLCDVIFAFIFSIHNLIIFYFFHRIHYAIYHKILCHIFLFLLTVIPFFFLLFYIQFFHNILFPFH